MPQSSRQFTNLSQRWQERQADVGRRRQVAFRGRRAVMVLLLLTITGTLGYFLFAPYWQPRTHLVVLPAAGLRVLHGPPVPVAGDELALLEPLRAVTTYHAADRFQDLFSSPSDLLGLSDQLARLDLRYRDTLIIYVAAQGFAYNGKAVLACNNFDPSQPGDGVLSCGEFLNELSDVPARTKLVILDAGWLDFDPQLVGVMGGEFPRVLANEVSQRGDASLWVCLSHNRLERSHRSAALGGSVFGTFVAKGLQGAADVDDLLVDTRELDHFVRPNVAAWVQQTTAEHQTQSPLLLWGGGDTQDAEPARLLSVADMPPELRRVRVPELIRTTARRRTDGAALQPDAAGRGLLAYVATPEEVAAPPTGDAGPADGTAGASQQGPDSTVEKPAGSGDANSGPTAEPAPRQKLLALVDNAWRLRDELERPLRDTQQDLRRPVDTTPHLWREVQEELVAYELVARSGQIAEVARLQSTLETALPKFWVTADDRQSATRDFLGLKGLPPAVAESGQRPPLDDLRSLALLERVAISGWPVPPADVEQLPKLQAILEELIEAPQEEVLQKIEALTLGPEYDRYTELQLAKRLKHLSLNDPDLVQLALRTRRRAEQVAAGPLWCSGWLTELVATADRQRLAGERQMFDQIRAGWPAVARKFLTQALAGYGEAERTCTQVHQAIELRNDLTFRVPYYVRAHRESATFASYDPSKFVSLSQLLDRLLELSLVLDAPSADRIAALQKLYAELIRLDTKQLNGPDAIDQLTATGRQLLVGDAWRVERLLATPLPAAAARRKLRPAAEEFDAKLALRFDLNAAGPLSGDDSKLLARTIRQCDLQWKLAQLGTWQMEEEATSSYFRQLKEAYSKLRGIDLSLQNNEASPAGEKLVSAWGRVRDFSVALQRFDRRMPGYVATAQRTASGLSRDAASRQAVRAQRALRLLDAREARRFRDTRLSDLSRRVDLHDTLMRQQERFLLAQHDALSDKTVGDLGFLNDAANAYRTQAAQLLIPTAVVAGAGPSVRIQAPELVSLVQESRADVEVSLYHRGVRQADVWVLLEYDPQRLQIEAQDGAAVLHVHRLKDQMEIQAQKLREAAESGDMLREKLQRALSYPYRPDLVSLPPTFAGVQSGKSPATLKLRVMATRDAADSAALIAKVISKSARDQEAIAYVRHRIDVPIRALNIVISGPPNSWTRAGDQVTLRPFPNRATDFRFGVINRGTIERANVNLRFHSPSSHLDLADLAARDTRTQIDASPLIAEQSLSVAVGDRVQYAGDESDAEPANGEASAEEEPAAVEPAADEPDESATEAKPPSGPKLPHGLIVKVSDRDDPLQDYYTQVDIEAQRPRRYVLPSVSYNTILERIEVSVKPRHVSLLPPGPVNVECEIAEDLAAATEGKLRAVLQPPDYEANLFAYVPATPPQIVTLYLHVDGYPRAFVYRVPSGKGAVDLPEKTDLAEMRILKSGDGKEYQKPMATTTVEVEVDSPIGSFEADSEGDRLRVALDENMDEKLGPERGARFTPDRDANSFFEGLAENGVMSLDTRVADFNIPLVTERLQNVSIQVHGRATAGGRQADAWPLTLNIDGNPPTIHFVEVSPVYGFVVAGTELEIGVWASDEMSGVESVALQFSEEAEPVMAILDPDAHPTDPAANLLDPEGNLLDSDRLPARSTPRRWVAAIPTEGLLGIQVLSVKATDHVGNENEPYLKRVQIVTPEQAAAKVAAQSKLVEGIVSFRDQPVPGAELALEIPKEEEEAAGAGGSGSADESDAWEQLRSVQAVADGSFQVANLPPGEYRLSAVGVINNVPRFGSQEFVVEETPGQVIRADIGLE